MKDGAQAAKPEALGRILVTGSSGFIGTNLVGVMLEGGVTDLLGIDVKPPRNQRHSRVFRQCDILNESDLRTTVRNFRPDTIIHLAARTDLRGTRLLDYEANVRGVSNLLSVVSALVEQPTVLWASSRMIVSIDYNPLSEYDYHPPNAYGESKVVGELLVRGAGLGRAVLARPTSIWGPWFEVPYRNFFDAIQRGYFYTVSGYNAKKAFGYVENAVNQLLTLAATEEFGPFWITDNDPYHVNEWANEIREELDARPIRSVSHNVLRLGAKVGDALTKLGASPPLTSFRLNNLITDVYYDNSRTRAIVGADLVPRKLGVQRTVRWMRAQKQTG